MDINTLINDTKARFSHNSAKAYLKEKYQARLIIAEQSGLWTASTELISFLSSINTKHTILIDNFNNPVKVDTESLLSKLIEVYNSVMQEWYDEWCTLETKR